MIELTITVNDAGQFSVTGPIEQKGLCYQLLELARDVIKDKSDELEKSRIVSPPPGLRLG